jgi:hypothetical protein
MADNIAVTQGSGTNVATDDVGGVHFQKVKLDVGGDGASVPATGDGTNGLDVDVTRVQGVVHVDDNAATLSVDDGGATLSVDDGGASVTVDSGQLPAALVGGRLDVNIGAAGATVPVSDAAGSLTVDSAQLPAALVGGRMDVNIGAVLAGGVPVADGGNVLSVDDGGATLSVDDGGGSVTVDGTVTANQGTPAAAANAWPVKVSDGTDTVGISTVSAAKALKVDVVQTVSAGSQTDKSAFVEGTGKCDVAGGVFNDAIGSDPTEDQAAALRITAKRGLHVNLRKADGTELGTAGAPVRTDPTGTTTQPVLDTNSAAALTALQLIDDPVATLGAAIPGKGDLLAGSDGGTARAIACNASGHVKVEDGGNSLTVDGTVTANQGTANATPWNENLAQVGGSAVGTAAAGIQKVGVVDEAGAAFGHANPLPVAVVPQEDSAQWRAAVTYSASQTDITIRTPSGGKKFVVLGVIIAPTATGILKIYDNTNAPANMLFQGTPNGTAPNPPIVIMFATPWKSSTANNVLRYSTDVGAAGDITAFGYEV